MKLPRDVSGASLVKALARLGYRVTRQSGSHIRLTCEQPAQHHVTIPNHDSLRIGTLAAILSDVAAHHGMQREALLERLFGR
jgi:predicted RNA binding protein YcfA (HicA-like mRNA interferase family)